MKATMVSSWPGAQWSPGRVAVSERTAAKAHIRLGDEVAQRIRGFGGAFSELGMAALQALSPEARAEAADWLFAPAKGCGFGLGRIPVGANDFALDWYSCDETPGDYRMEGFSIARDRELLIPFIRLAQERSPGMRFFCSPWSPPTWMKTTGAYNSGSLRPGSDYANAYALYLSRFIESYGDEGIPIDQVFVQNEPNSDHPFPCCRWSPEEMRDFMKNHLHPMFAERRIKTEIWLGTMEKGDAVGWDRGRDEPYGRSDWRDWIWPFFAYPELGPCPGGVGFQWDGKAAIQRTRTAFPDLPVIGSECECGDGKNSWEHAHYVFDLLWTYLANGAEAFMHWNLVLANPGVSTWGWPQNSLLSIDRESRIATRNPEYWLMRHLSGFVPAGSRFRGTTGPWAPFVLAFELPGDKLALVVANPERDIRLLTADCGAESLACELPPYSFSTIVVEETKLRARRNAK